MARIKKIPRLLFLLSAFFVFGSARAAVVEISEIAWMGTQNSAQDEWLELYSSDGAQLEGWTLIAADGGMTINLSGQISAGGYFLIERTDDNTLPNVSADLIVPFGNGLNNNGEHLILKDSSGAAVDSVDASSGWPAGDNSTKETMQKNSSGAWITAAGTPKAANYEVTLPPPPPSPPPAPPPPPPSTSPPTSEITAPAPSPSPTLPPPAPTPEPPPPAPVLTQTPTPAPAPVLAPPPPSKTPAGQAAPAPPSTPSPENPEIVSLGPAETQPAQVSKPFFSKSSWLWLLAALGLGVLSALGYLVSRRI